MKDRRSNKIVESTYMRFEVEVNVPGFPEDDGDALSKEVQDAIFKAVLKFDPLSKIRETTE